MGYRPLPNSLVSPYISRSNALRQFFKIVFRYPAPDASASLPFSNQYGGMAVMMPHLQIITLDRAGFYARAINHRPIHDPSQRRLRSHRIIDPKRYTVIIPEIERATQIGFSTRLRGAREKRRYDNFRPALSNPKRALCPGKGQFMTGPFDNQSIEIPCPKCGNKAKQAIAWLKTNRHYICRRGTRIDLQADQFKREIAKVERASDEIRRTLGKIGR
jgi:hypothetical protein